VDDSPVTQKKSLAGKDAAVYCINLEDNLKGRVQSPSGATQLTDYIRALEYVANALYHAMLKTEIMLFQLPPGSVPKRSVQLDICYVLLGELFDG